MSADIPNAGVVDVELDYTDEMKLAAKAELEGLYRDWAKRHIRSGITSVVLMTAVIDGKVGSGSMMTVDPRFTPTLHHEFLNRMASVGWDSFAMIGMQGGNHAPMIITQKEPYTNPTVAQAFTVNCITFTEIGGNG
jgi:hypothetical protein